MRAAWKQLLGLLLAAALGSALCLALNRWDNKYTRPGAQPLEGLLVLSEEELDRTDVHFLIRGWAFYPGVLLTPEELAAHGSEHYMVYTSVGQRTRFDREGENDPHGCGTYVLELRLPERAAEYALELPEIYSAYRLYLNGRLALQMGDPETYRPLTQNRMAGFTGSGRVTVMLAVSDRSHFYSGLVYPPAFGSPLALNLIRGERLGLAVCVSLCGLLGAALAFYLGLRMRHKNAVLFALLSLTAALFTAYPLLHSGLALPPQPWYALEIFGAYLMVALVVLLQNRMCRTDRWLSRLSVWAGGAFALLALGYGLCSAHLSVTAMRAFSALAVCFKAGAALYLLAVSLDAARRRVPHTDPLPYVAVFYGTLLVWDRLLPDFEPVVTGWFFEWGGLVMILAIGYILWRDVVSAYADNLTFAEEHRQMKRQLAMQAEYASQMAERSAENRKLIHDFRQHLRAITEMAFRIESRPETAELKRELLRYLEEFPQVIPRGAGVSPGCFCNHASVDALLQYYHAAALRQGIRARLAFRLPDGIPLSDVEWCSVLGNLLENAMEACQRLAEGAGTISISVRPMRGTFFLLVENSYDGHYDRQGGRFRSRKTGAVRYGIGLESVRETVTRCGGTLDIYPLETVFRVGITLPVREGPGAPGPAPK